MSDIDVGRLRRYRRTRRGKVLQVLQERYLRDDLGFGLLVNRGLPIRDEEALQTVLVEPQHHENASPRIYVVDAQVVLKDIDVLEYPCYALANVVVCHTVLEEVKRQSREVYKRFMRLLLDEKRCYIAFANENCRETYLSKAQMESDRGYNDRLVENTASWFASNIPQHIAKVTLLMADTSATSLTKPNKVQVTTLHDVVRKDLGETFPVLLDILSFQAGNDRHENINIFQEHLSMEETDREIAAGRLWKGIFRAKEGDYNEGTVLVYGKLKENPKEPIVVVLSGSIAINRATDGDRVALRILDDTENERNKKRGQVVGILERNWRQYCASIDEKQVESKNSHDLIPVIPVNRKIPPIAIRTHQLKELLGQRIVVSIDAWDPHSPIPIGHFIRKLGKINDKETENMVVLLENDIPTNEFSKDVLNCLPKQGKDWVVTTENSKGRMDLRSLTICSIDPPGCKDIDDALHARTLENGNVEVGVHIADVTHFVHPGTPIDEEARNRGNTTYLVERRLDMLPGLLTTDICSLRGNVDRFAFSVIWEFTPPPELKQVSVRFSKSIIRSKGALSYQQAQAWLDDTSEKGEIQDGVRKLFEVSQILKQRRIEAGAIMIEQEEPGDEKPLPSQSLVEELMILANIAVAKRIHQTFHNSSLLRRNPMDVEDGQPRLRSAKYFRSGDLPIEDHRHFGLGTPIYTHFTSPIRRYADVVVHRLLQCTLQITPPGSYAEALTLRKTCDLLNRRKFNSEMAEKENAAFYKTLETENKDVTEESKKRKQTGYSVIEESAKKAKLE